MATTAEAFVHPELLIDTDTLEHRLGDPALRILDCTTHLIPDPKITYQVVPGRADFEKGHIPGAQFVDIQADLSDNSHRLRFMKPSAETFAGAMSRFGVGEGTRGRPVQHDDAAMGDAGVVAAADLRLRRRGCARWRLAEMEPRGPTGRNRAGSPATAREFRRPSAASADGWKGSSATSNWGWQRCAL